MRTAQMDGGTEESCLTVVAIEKEKRPVFDKSYG
jgi:hypothetical protein